MKQIQYAISTTILTSEYGAVASAVTKARPILTDETMLVVREWLKEARNRLTYELTLAFPMFVGLHRETDPMSITCTIPDQEYHALTTSLTNGFYGRTELIHLRSAAMENVGYIRSIKGSASSPRELLLYLEAIPQLNDLMVKKAEEGDYDSELELIQRINVFILAMCAPNSRIRNEMVADYL